MRVIAALLISLITGPALAAQATAVFAGGCFWCTESDFEKLDGVSEAISGYAGGDEANPTYEQVSSGATGHTESVQVIYDPDKISYAQLLDWFWRHMDPTDADGQFVDRGRQYRGAIFFETPEQEKQARASKTALEKSGRFEKPIVTEITPLKAFYPAEEYHQDYYKRNPLRYKFYRYNSGRDQFLEKHWDDPDHLPGGKKANAEAPMSWRGPEHFNKPDEATLRTRLSPLSFQVTQEDDTEPAFKNTYWDNKQQGIYVDVVSGEPLFSSTDKYESGTGWPSFTKPISPDAVTTREDSTLWMVRTEVRSRYAESHLGHVFKDGPRPTGERWCMNSAAMRFIPKEDMAAAGYGQYLTLFE